MGVGDVAAVTVTLKTDVTVTIVAPGWPFIVTVKGISVLARGDGAGSGADAGVSGSALALVERDVGFLGVLATVVDPREHAQRFTC